MSATSPLRPVLPPDIRARKGSTPLVVLTAYTTPMARLVDAHCDIALVGDSLGMVLHGMPSTLGVTMEMMILHGRSVVRGCQKAMVVIDMPFGSYEEGPAQAYRNAARLMAETGAPAVKLEGGAHMAETIAFLTKRGVPVMAHIGLTPQAVNTLGGYKVVGRDDEADRVMQDALAVQAAGAFSVVLEKVPMGLAGRITKDVDGVLQTHRFIRSDLFANPADAERFMVQKAHTFIDQMGERMFEPRVKPDASPAP